MLAGWTHVKNYKPSANRKQVELSAITQNTFESSFSTSAHDFVQFLQREHEKHCQVQTGSEEDDGLSLAVGIFFFLTELAFPKLPVPQLSTKSSNGCSEMDSGTHQITLDA